jgi:plasmid stabilization system protein ParE
LRIRYATEAYGDLLSALEYIVREDPAAAARVDERLQAAIERRRFRTPGDCAHHRCGGRSWPVRPFRIYYQRTADELLIVHIYHQARSPIAK